MTSPNDYVMRDELNKFEQTINQRLDLLERRLHRTLQRALLRVVLVVGTAQVLTLVLLVLVLRKVGL